MSKKKQSENAEKGTKKKIKEKWIEKKPREKKWGEMKMKRNEEDQSRIGPSRDEKWPLV